MRRPTEEEFEWKSETKLVHVPTGATYTKGDYGIRGQAGEYDLEEVTALAIRLMRRKQAPRWDSKADLA